VIAGEDLDLHALGGGAEILHRFPRDPNRAGTRNIGVEARLIVEHADPDRAAAIFRVDGARARPRRQNDAKPSPPLAHDDPPCFR
jgi:hypothetical protein